MSFISSEPLGSPETDCPRGLGAPRESGLGLLGWAPTDSQVGVSLGRPCPQPQFGENTVRPCSWGPVLRDGEK